MLGVIIFMYGCKIKGFFTPEKFEQNMVAKYAIYDVIATIAAKYIQGMLKLFFS